MAAHTLTTKQIKSSGFCNQLTGDLTGNPTIVAAVAGKSIHITSITIFTATVNTFIIQDNTSSPIPILGPFTTAATYSGGVFRMQYDQPIKVAEGKQVDVDTSASATCCVVIQGTIE